ncbi:MAG: hypothetical protein AAF849_14020 [Bacteroidota bacterium]
MENVLVNRYMRLLAPLTVDVKLALLSKISESLRKEYKAPASKEILLEELSGAWKNTSPTLAQEIINARTTGREISL